MRFIADHDLHIHTHLSACSNDPAQNPAYILRYGQENGLRDICITDHLWDSAVPGGTFYSTEAPTTFRWGDLNAIQADGPLPQSAGTKLHFGAEVDMDGNHTIGISRAGAEELEFMVVATTHLHILRLPQIGELEDLQMRRELFLHRWQVLLESGLPAGKVGLPHITCNLIADSREQSLRLLDSIPDAVFLDYFAQTERRGIGVELNQWELPELFPAEDHARLLRVYRLAVESGCHFYLASDAHHPASNENSLRDFNRWIDLLHLEEDQKFCPFREVE